MTLGHPLSVTFQVPSAMFALGRLHKGGTHPVAFRGPDEGGKPPSGNTSCQLNLNLFTFVDSEPYPQRERLQARRRIGVYSFISRAGTRLMDSKLPR